MATNTNSSALKITQIHSAAGRIKSQRATLIGLGLNKMYKTVTLPDTAEVRGMLRVVHHLVKVEAA